MTKKQIEEMERLADSHRPYLTKESFFAGYKAAQEPSQLILNEKVESLVECIREVFCNVALPEKYAKCCKKALRPFQNLGDK